MKISVNLELEDAPNWLSHIEMTQEDDGSILFEVIRVNGSSCGYYRMTAITFNNMADLLLTAKE